MARFNISPIKFDTLSFLILDCPSDKTLPDYVPILEEHNTTDLVRLCEGSPYNIQPLTNIGIMVHDDMKFEDGTAPNERI
ncbi:Protein tyrosine phosphatase type IVA 1, partial [Mortierella sp. AM989]